MNNLDFSKYQDIKVESYGTLFSPDFLEAKQKSICPYCFRKLYEMRDRPLLYCKNKLHKRFVMKRE